MNSQERPRRLDAVEIKVTVWADGIQAAAEAFELEHAEKRHRTIYFCEDLTGPDGPAGLPLLTHGIILRLRRNKGRREDITAKLRPCRDSQLTQRWINAREDEDEDWDFRVEGDWAGPRHVISASLEAKIEDGHHRGRGGRRSRDSFGAGPAEISGGVCRGTCGPVTAESIGPH
jgi:hypothetical protein